MKPLLKILLLLCPLFMFSQADSTYFSNAIRKNFAKYQNSAATAYNNGNTERGKFLFDSLVSHRLRGTILDNFTFKKHGGGKLQLNQIQRPTVILTFSSWCVPGIGEIPAINRLAKKYRKDVQYVVIFWDRKRNMRKMASKFSGNIIVCYAHESYRNDAQKVAVLKHTLGFPTSFYLDENRKIIDIKRCSISTPAKKSQYQRSYAQNYNNYLEGLHLLLMNFELKKEMLAVN